MSAAPGNEPWEVRTADDLATDLYYLTLDYWSQHDLSVEEVVATLRARAEELLGFLCLDCGLDTIKSEGNYYMVWDEVWLSAVPDRKGTLCLACLASRLNRELSDQHFRVLPSACG